MMATITRTLMLSKHTVGEIEVEVEVSANVTPYRPGVYSGPPEACYPDEPGYADEIEAVVVLHEQDLAAIAGDDWVGRAIEELLEKADDEAEAAAEARAVSELEDR